MPRKIAEAVKTGDPKAAYEAERDRLAEAIDATESARDLAALFKQLNDVLDRIAALPIGEEESASAQIEKRRDARRAAAENPPPEDADSAG